MDSKQLLTAVLILAALKVITALKWDTSTSQSPVGVSISACAGDTVTLMWNYTLEPAEHLMSVEWYFRPSGSPDEQMMATRVAGNFLPVPSAKWQVEYMPTAGIKLLNVAASGTGNYSVHVNINLHGSVVTETQTVGVQVNENTADCTTDAERLVAMEALVNSLTSQNNQLQQERDNLTRLVQTLTSEVTNLMKQGEQQRAQIQDLLARLQQLEGTSPRTTAATTTGATTEAAATPPPDPPFVTCQDVLAYHSESGVYTLHLDPDTPVQVYCDQETDGGGWTLIQRRQDGRWMFHRGWQEYVDGFGDIHTEFWLGLENMYRMTNESQFHLRVDLWDFDNNTAYAEYDWFNLTDGDTFYKLNAVWYNGTAGDAIGFPSMEQQNWPFTAPNWDHDGWPLGNCGDYDHGNGGWWFGKNCGMCNLNGRYNMYGRRGMMWYTWKNDYTVLSRAEMKIRPAD